MNAGAAPSFSASFAGGRHPNAVIARREMERQEKSRLRRLSEVRPSSSNSNATGGGRRQERPSSAGRFSRPTSASRPLSGHRMCEDFESLRSRVPTDRSPGTSPGTAAGWRDGRGAQGLVNGRRSCSESARLRTDFMLSPLRRMEDAANMFPVSTPEQAQALQEELQSWYFSNGETFNIEVAAGTGTITGRLLSTGTMVEGCPWTTSADAHNKPSVDVLEEAAAGVKAKVAATDAFRIPPPMPGGYNDGGDDYAATAVCNRMVVEGVKIAPSRRMCTEDVRIRGSGGCRGVAEATANRQFSAAAH